MIFVQPKISLPRSLQPGPYFDTDLQQSINCTLFTTYYVRFNIILLSTRKHSKCTLLFGFPHQNALCLFVVSCAFHPTCLDFFTPKIFGTHYWSRSSTLCKFHHSSDSSYIWAQISSLASCSPTLLLVSPSGRGTNFRIQRLKETSLQLRIL